MSFIDFKTYLDYFHNYEGYLNKFMDSILKVAKQPLYQRLMRDKGGDISAHPGTCDQPPRCRAPSKTYHEAFDCQGRKHWIRENHESLCRNRHITWKARASLFFDVELSRKANGVITTHQEYD